MFWFPLLNSIFEILPGICVLLMLHFLRNAIGNHALHIIMGVFMLLSLTSGMPYFMGDSSTLTAESLNYGNLLVSVYSALLLIYELHGVRETQRTLLGLILTLLFLGLFMSLSINAYYPILLDMFAGRGNLVGFIETIRRSLSIFIISNLICILGLPVLFQLLRNIRLPFFCALFVCNVIIMLGRELDFMYTFPQTPRKELLMFLGIRLLSTAVASAIVAVYLHFSRIVPFERKPSLSIFSNIFTHLLSTEKMRQAMAEWEEKYQAVLNHSAELIFIINADGFILNANLAAYRTIGKKLAARPAIGNLILDGQMQPFKLPDNGFSMFDSDTALVKPYRYHDMTIATDNDAKRLEIDFNLTNAAIEGEPVYLLIAHDVTERHEQEKKQLELQKQLYHSQRLESLGILAGGIAHDFNNMLHSVQGNTESLQQMPLGSNAKAMLTNIDDAIQRASQLVSQLLGFARKGSINPATIEVGLLLKQTVNLFKPSARQIDLKLLLEPGSIFVKADAVQLQQAIFNLLINARDALEHNADDHPPKITLRAERLRDKTPEWNDCPYTDTFPDDYVCIKVKDNGPGIPEDIRPRIFEPFFTTKEIGKGTGMGLAMVYGCVTSLKGWLSLASSLGKGTEFTIVLPKAA